jgi:phosphohistidine phosphatase
MPAVEDRAKLVYLLRHAKSSWGDRSQDDHARSLNARGRHAADRMGEFLAGREELPDLVLCSSSRRTRETLERVQRRLDVEPSVEIERALYLASCETLLGRLRELPEEVERVLLVGHNPGIGELAERLAREGPAELRESLGEKFPTGALAIIRLSAPRWIGAAQGGRLEAFVCPRDLEG